MRVNKLSFVVFLSLLSSPIWAVQQYMLVQCATNIEIAAVHSDPDTGELKRDKTCPLAFAAVPNNYVYVSTAPSGNSGEVKYLFIRT